MKKLFALFFSALMLFSLTACGSSNNKNVSAENKKNSSTAEIEKTSTENKILVAYFSCTGNTKKLAENISGVAQADLYEIKPEIPYTSEDLNYSNEKNRATVEQRNENARPALADKNANISAYDTIIIAYPIWWGIEPKIIDTFVENYDFSGKKVIPICTSGGSDIKASEENLKNLAKSAIWMDGRLFSKNISKNELKNWLENLK